MRWLTILALALLAAFPAAAKPGAPKLYVVLYEVEVDAAGKVASLKVDKVLDPSLASSPDDAMNHPVDLAVPEAYLAAVRAFLGKRTYDKGPDKFFTYTFFDPLRPDDAEPD